LVLSVSLFPHHPGPTSDLPSVCHQNGVVWTSLLGHTYHLPARPIIEPLPDPFPLREPATPPVIQHDDDWDNSSIWDGTSSATDTTLSP